MEYGGGNLRDEEVKAQGEAEADAEARESERHHTGEVVLKREMHRILKNLPCLKPFRKLS